jgi:ribosomal protein L32E
VPPLQVSLLELPRRWRRNVGNFHSTRRYIVDMKQRPETEFIKAKYTLHVDHTGYTALRHVTIVEYAKNGVPIPHGIRRHLKVVTLDN